MSMQLYVYIKRERERETIMASVLELKVVEHFGGEMSPVRDGVVVGIRCGALENFKGSQCRGRLGRLGLFRVLILLVQRLNDGIKVWLIEEGD